MAHDFDVIIAGGGPAGSVTAGFLRKRGRRVLVLERETFPRFHIGESLLHFSGEVWTELGVMEQLTERFLHKPGARFIHNESGAHFTYPFSGAVRGDWSHAFQVPRAEFDELLLRHAQSLGADVREAHEVRDLDIHDAGVRVRVRDPHGAESEHSAAAFVDATGRDTFLGTRLRLKAADDLIDTNVACFTHFENTQREPGAEEGNITIILFDGGWWWFIPFRGTLTSVGCVLQRGFTIERRGMDADGLFAAALAATPAAAELLRGARRVRPIGTTGNWSYRCRQFYGDRFLLVGDAAAFIDPLFSTGVHLAAFGARYAAQALDEGISAGDLSAARLAAYQQEVLRGAELFKGLVHEFYGESLRQLLVHSAEQPVLCSVITSYLAGDVYRPAVWHSLAQKGGFSQTVLHGQRTRLV